MSSEFDDVTIAIMTGAAEPARVLFVTSMFRLSRNIGKLLHILEFPLGNGAAVLTTNYLLRRDEAFLRRAIVQVDARALSSAHRTALRACRAHIARPTKPFRGSWSGLRTNSDSLVSIVFE
jgi:hypothetical protein